MKDIKLLVADDDRAIRQLLRRYLEIEGYRVDVARDGDEALALFYQNAYHLVLLDIMMPKKDGIEVCETIRETSNVPIMMLTSKGEEMDKLLGLGIGADDYMTKPFSIHEVKARVKSLLRRFLVLGSEQPPTETCLTYGDLKIQLDTMEVSKDGETIPLTAKEFEILRFLASHPNQVFTKKQIFTQVWGDDYMEDHNTVMVHIRRLRKKIEDEPNEPKYIITLWGIGYKFSGSVET